MNKKEIKFKAKLKKTEQEIGPAETTGSNRVDWKRTAGGDLLGGISNRPTSSNQQRFYRNFFRFFLWKIKIFRLSFGQRV